RGTKADPGSKGLIATNWGQGGAMTPAITTALLDWLIKASWQSAAIAAAVIVLQAAFGRWLGPRWRFVLWLLVFAPLAMPLHPHPTFSLFRWTEPPAESGIQAPPLDSAPAETQTVSIRYLPLPPQTVMPRSAPFDRSVSWQQVVLTVWTMGAATMIVR